MLKSERFPTIGKEAVTALRVAAWWDGLSSDSRFRVMMGLDVGYVECGNWSALRGQSRQVLMLRFYGR